MYTSSSNSDHQSETFDIRNFLDRLTPAKEKNKYICPVCDGHNLGINPENGKYQCFNGCECSDIREAISPWAEVVGKRGSDRSQWTNTLYPKSRFTKQSPKPAPIPQGELVVVRLAQFEATDIPSPQKPQFVPDRVIDKLKSDGATAGELKEITVTTYDYGNGQTVHRFECKSAAHYKGRAKSFSQSHVDGSGKTRWNKGNKPWKAYRLTEALAAASSVNGVSILLQHEGEGCVEIGRVSAIAGFTFQGSGWDKKTISNEYQRALSAGIGLIVFLHDFDDAGLKKAQLCQKCADKVGIAFIAINPHDICPDLPYKSSDIKEILGQMSVPDFIRKLEEEIHAAVAKRSLELQQEKEREEQLEDARHFQISHYDPENPESFYKPICERLGLSLTNCVTSTTFDGWAYRNVFDSAQNWRVIDSAFYRWSESVEVWQHQPDNRIYTLVADAGERAFKLKHSDKFGWQVIKPYETNSHKESAFKFCRSRLERPEPLPTNTHLLAFGNCVVDLRTGQQLPKSKDFYLTHLIPHDYSPNKPCPEVFHAFIVDSFGSDMLSVIRAFTSMFLDPTAPYGRFPHLIGQSGGGKGTLGRFWGSLFGEEGCGSAANFVDISTPEGRHQYLTGKRIFGFPDMGGYAEGVRAFYELVDNGPMTGRALFNPVAYDKQWYMRFWLASVDHLQIENAGDGWVRRAYPIPVKSRDITPDPDLRVKLEAAKADVISWALAMPRDERDRILLSRPESERAINLALDAALYGDSTKSFVDLCLRPSSEASFVPNHLLHSWYVAYCKEHGYNPLGMSKFISHLKTILPRNSVDRSWSPMVNGKRDRIQAHWSNLASLPGVFVSWEPSDRDSGERLSPPQNPIWICIKSKCNEGGLMDFEDFWSPPNPPDDSGNGGNGGNGSGNGGNGGNSLGSGGNDSGNGCNSNGGNGLGSGGNTPTSPTPNNPPIFQGEFLENNPPKSPEASHSIGVQPVQGEIFHSPHPGQAETTQYQWCPPCPIVQGTGFDLEKNNEVTQRNYQIVETNFSFSPITVGGQNMDTLDSRSGTGFQKTALKSVFSGQIANTLLFDSVANAQLVLDTLTESNAGELLSDLIGMWSESEKTAVLKHFTHEQVEAVRQTLKQYRAATHKTAVTHETANVTIPELKIVDVVASNDRFE